MSARNIIAVMTKGAKWSLFCWAPIGSLHQNLDEPHAPIVYRALPSHAPIPSTPRVPLSGGWDGGVGRPGVQTSDEPHAPIFLGAAPASEASQIGTLTRLKLVRHCRVYPGNPMAVADNLPTSGKRPTLQQRQWIPGTSPGMTVGRCGRSEANDSAVVPAPVSGLRPARASTTAGLLSPNGPSPEGLWPAGRSFSFGQAGTHIPGTNWANGGGYRSRITP